MRKSSGLRFEGRLFVAVKVVAFFADRPTTLGLPSIVGLIELFDGETGQPLAVMESGLITALRTAAVAALVADTGRGVPELAGLTVDALHLSGASPSVEVGGESFRLGDRKSVV